MIKMFCINCDKDSKYRCSICNQARYCSKKCQKEDWSSHKQECKLISNYIKYDDAEQQALANGALVIDYLNPDPDKTLETHGQNSSPMLICNEDAKKLLKLINVSPHGCTILMNDPSTQGVYGKCYNNVENIVKRKGGTMVCGWMLYENEYMIEAEAHCAWKPPNSNFTLNVTPSIENIAYGGIFVSDKTMRKFIDNNNAFPANKLLWK